MTAQVQNHPFKPGQIFYISWGYDQTNVDFYKLLSLKGKTMGLIVPIGSKLISADGCSNQVAPDPDSLRDWDVLLGVESSNPDKAVPKKLNEHGFSIRNHYRGRPWDRESIYETDVRCGH